ncbi:sulfotransferase family 2 domain-containing protein [Microbulbifer sp. MCCC 1A16149]|uniref:sulfotransferase family 2 domain-containing protein n=1 Tax=Microbulbifer sp. MCCC 1A16149 TaxID=3411322 RepID=UPI003D110FAB
MLVSSEKKFLFYHVYKVAGTSIREALRPYCSFKQIAFQNFFYGLSTMGVRPAISPLYQFHPKLSDVRNSLGDLFYEYYRFTFVRHPLDWQKSLYFFMKKNPRHHQHKLISTMSFDEYLNWRVDNECNLMSDLISDSTGEILVDDIYKFEVIDREFESLSKKIGLCTKLPHKNVAGMGRSVDLKESTYLKFREAFSQDFNSFGYE